MSKKDYVSIARIVKLIADEHVRIMLANRLGVIFADDNPNFDMERWCKACAVPL